MDSTSLHKRQVYEAAGSLDMEEISRGYWLGTVPHAGGVVGSSGKRMAARVSRGSSGKRLIFEGCFLGNYPQRGDGETFQERFKSRRISRDSENTRDHTSFPGNYSQRGDGGTFRERFRSRRISRNPENTGDHTFTSGKLPAAGRWKILLGKV